MPGLLHARYDSLASNTIDYWMLPDDPTMTHARIQEAYQDAHVYDCSTLQIYIHVPFCAQRCRFCAFSGGNALNFQQAERYTQLVVKQLKDLVARCPLKGRNIRSVNIGGGSPDLVKGHIRRILAAVHDLPGFTEETEISVEFTLSTTTEEFIRELIRFGVTKASFGIQSLNPNVRHYMRQPKRVLNFDRVLDWIDGQIPLVNADLITGLPGQSLHTVFQDLSLLMNDSRINAISSYLLTPGAAPSLVAAIESKTIPEMPSHFDQALMRLHTYSTFLRAGWKRKGTNTYIDPSRVPSEVIDRVAGNECIGTQRFEDFLIGVGPQAISFVPGARIENLVDIRAWAKAIDEGTSPFHLAKCSDQSQRDTALWVFPLRWEGLDIKYYNEMLRKGAISEGQAKTLSDFVDEGLIVQDNEKFRLSIVGEVFMGRLVRDLKHKDGQRAIDEYIAEGHALAQAILSGEMNDDNLANNRQLNLVANPEGK